MSIPDYQTLMLPLLKALSDGRDHGVRDLTEHLADEFGLTADERRQLKTSGRQPLLDNRVQWAKFYLDKAGLVASPSRGVYRITERGLQVLSRNPPRVDVALLSQFPEFKEFKTGSTSVVADEDVSDSRETDETPEEALDSAYRQLRKTVEAELLQQVKAASPTFFEQLVVELLVAMGYGGSLKDAGQAIGRSGDGGIDGIIKEDRLGLDVIHVQAKRWEQTVGEPEVRAFAGSLDGVRAKKGIFLTTSAFSAQARGYVDRIDKRIVLIDGSELASLMFEFGIGVTRASAYEVKDVDPDYFLGE